MATYTITAPDGKDYSVDGAEGMTQDQVIAEVTRQVPSLAAPPEPVEEASFVDRAANLGAGINKGLLDLVDMPFTVGNVVKRGVQDIAGGLGFDYESTPSMLPSQMPLVKDFTDKAKGRFVPKGQDAIADALRTSGEWGSGLLLNPASKLPDLLAGGGAAFGEFVGDGSPIGEVIGGFTGMLGGSKFANRVPKTPDATAEDKALNFIMENAENPQQAIANLRLAEENGEIGSLAEKTRDRGIFNIEEAGGKGSLLKHELDKTTQLRGEQIIDEVGDVFGEGGDAATIASKRKTDLQLPITAKKQQAIKEGNIAADDLVNFERQLPEAQAKLAEAEAQVQKASDVVDTNLKPSQAGEKLSGGYNTVESQFIKEKEKPVWKRFSNGKDLDVVEVKDIVDGGRAKLNETDNAILDNKFSSQLSLIDKWDETVAPDEIHSVISQIKKINSNAKENNDYDNANRLLSKVGDSLETSLKELGSKSNYDRAVAISKEKFERFHPSRVGKERGKSEAQTLGTRMLDTKTGGAAIGDLIKQADSPFITKQMEGVIKSVAKDEGVNDAFLKNYDELLDRFPELKSQLQDVKKAQDNLVSADKNVTTATKADDKTTEKLPQAIATAKKKVKADADSTANKLNKSVSNLQINNFKKDTKGFVDKALKGTAEDLTKLNRQMGRVDGGKEALKASVKDNIINKISVSKDGEKTVPFSAIDDFSKSRDNLIKSGILTKDEAAQIDKILEKSTISGLRRKAAVQKVDDAQNALSDVLSSAGAIAALGMLPASNQLMLAGTIKRIMKKQLDGGNVDKKTIEALNTMILDPKKFLQGVSDRKITTAKDLEKYLATYINSVSQSISDDKEE